MEKINKISKKQRSAMHVYFEELSRELTNTGCDFKVMLQNVNVSPTPEILKGVYRKMATEKFGVQSTEQLTTKQVAEVWEDYNLWLSDYGVHISFPSYTDLIDYEKNI